MYLTGIFLIYDHPVHASSSIIIAISLFQKAELFVKLIIKHFFMCRKLTRTHCILIEQSDRN